MCTASIRVRSVIEEDSDEDEVAEWDVFWVYFDKQWMPILDSWNICEEDGDGSYKKIMNRTNNGLERYNRHINQLFPNTPSLLEFCETMEEESRRVTRHLHDIDMGVVKRPTYMMLQSLAFRVPTPNGSRIIVNKSKFT